MAIPPDPNAPGALDIPSVYPPVWSGAWPPDPSWDLPPPPAIESPVPPGPYPGPAAAEPADAGLITIEPSVPPAPAATSSPAPGIPAPAAPNWSGLAGPDVVTGGTAPPPDAADITIEPNTPAPPVDAGAAALALPTEDERVRTLSDLARTDPVAFAQLQAKHTMAAEDQAVTARMKAAADERKAAEDAHRVRQEAITRTRQKTDEIAAEADRLASAKVDPDGWRDSRNLFQTISMYVAGIVGGLVQSRQGGPNQGLAMINAAIERHIDAQKASLAQRRAALGEKRAAIETQAQRDDQDFRDEEAFRLNAYKRALDDIETERQNYDPAGSRSLKLAAVGQGVRVQLEATRQALIDKTLEREGKAVAIKVSLENAAEAKRHNRVEEGNAGGRLALDQAQFKAGLGDKAFEQAMKLAELPGKLATAGQPKAEDLRVQQMIAENTDARTPPPQIAVERDAKGNFIERAVPMMNADGKPYRFPSATEAPALRAKLVAAGQVGDLIHEVLAIRDKVGGESSAFNSNDYQRLKALQNQLVILQKSGTQGMSSDEDMKKLAAAIGADSITSFRARAAGLREGLQRTEDGLNAVLTANNYTGKRITLPDRWKDRPPSVDENVDALSARPSDTNRLEDVGFLDLPSLRPDVAGTAPVGSSAEIEKAAGRLADQVRGGDEAAAHRLAEVAASAPDPAARRLAAISLLRLRHEGNALATDIVAQRMGDVLAPLLEGE